MIPADHTILSVLECVRASEKLEKVASAFEHDDEVQEKIAVIRSLIDIETMELSKVAAGWGGLGKKLLTGAAVGTGVALPVTLGGAMLLNRATQEAKETSADLRNKILQTALGVGAMGAGLYGLHGLAKSKGWVPDLSGKKPRRAKRAADRNEEVRDLTTKLATVGAVEGMLQGIPTANLSKEAEALLGAVRALNRQYATQLLREACEE